jgi:hypothetical protein
VFARIIERRLNSGRVSGCRLNGFGDIEAQITAQDRNAFAFATSEYLSQV